MTTRRRTQAERDAMTVEIGYALLTACLLGAVVFAALVWPAAVWHLPPATERIPLTAGAVIAGTLAVLRVIHVLWRYDRQRPSRTTRPGDPETGPEAGGRGQARKRRG
ncbi:DUF6332 family protein [Streptomyces sp. W1SF4]|uniref:DUF6332 family protein n=1 Tax=Streptomyces sp. W1SF4 TaxID=2305220 RepID=UPI000F6E9684|nr:DUF6332 family protein [Streptomyces sp. W1SF4]AZM87284.1 hypothetical protein D1J60_01175 [Streptomyces sp. W1SF4]